MSESKVSLVTVALDNRTLLETLVEHRMLREELESEDMAQVTRKLWGSRVENEADIREMLANLPNIKEDAFESCFRKVGLNIDPLPKYRKFIALKDRIRKLVERDYEVSDVFVTFETEAGQRKALESLSVGKLSLFCNRANIPDYCKFRGEDILDIIEAPEPNAVRWMDLAMSRWQVASGLIISTSLIVVLTTIWCTFIVWRTWNEGKCIMKRKEKTMVSILITNVLAIANQNRSLCSHLYLGHERNGAFFLHKSYEL